MSDSNHNIKLHYLYRDGANYKQYHYEVYTNVQGLSLEEIERRLRAQLIDGEWFYNHNWDLKDLHHHPWDNSIDHTWHEFDCIECTDEPPSLKLWRPRATKGDVSEGQALPRGESIFSDSRQPPRLAHTLKVYANVPS